jgi:outer membrane protein OmpA-like peptidoglycan-associated protein
MKQIYFLIKLALLLFVLINISSIDLNAQVSNDEVTWKDTTRVKYNSWYIGGMLGVDRFYGDISEHTYWPGSGRKGNLNWYVGAKGGLEFNQRFGARVNFGMGQLFSTKDGNWFKADVRDLTAEFTVNMTNLVAPYVYNKKWNFTVYVGGGFFGYRSILSDSNNNPINAVGYDDQFNKDKLKYNSTFTFGGIVAYKLSKRLDIFGEIGISNTPVDDLDAKPVTLSELDNYSHMAIGLHYTFGKYQQAYKWNPKEAAFTEIEDEIVDMGNKIEDIQKCCEENKLNPCDTSTVDDDVDGVPNCRDKELNSPKGSIVNFQGIALIKPDSSGNMNSVGVAPIAKKPAKAAPAIFFSPVYFEFDKTVIDSAGENPISNVALYMAQYPEVKILISGNTDKHGDMDYNEDLSSRRCEKVKKILVDEYSIDPARLETQPNGKRFILFPKKDHINRRVDFSVVED